MGGDDNLRNYLAWPIELYIEQITIDGCTGWSAPLLFACNKIRFSRDEVHMSKYKTRVLKVNQRFIGHVSTNIAIEKS